VYDNVGFEKTLPLVAFAAVEFDEDIDRNLFRVMILP
jgi:hypothetical protein